MLDQLYPEKCQGETDKLEMHHHQDDQPRALGQDRQPGAPGYGGEPRASGQGLQPGRNGICEVPQSGPQDHQLMRIAKLRYTAGGRRNGVGAGGGSAVQTSGCLAGSPGPPGEAGSVGEQGQTGQNAQRRTDGGSAPTSGFPGMPGLDEQAGCAPSPGTAGPQIVPGNDIKPKATEQDGHPGEPGTFIINSARVPGPPGSSGQPEQ
ncbi:hypothetical protein B9Z55_026403 [Caenorhabditis nigoni]|uniref:Uncharacterized protein n=1 Tax=Caenorhabditis nigoni TaxID=1611254 RepID=A0A2G5T345_9PELO|nr:hypothetical protein B9Z55_026403 [Caenorhabditis nigoni]